MKRARVSLLFLAVLILFPAWPQSITTVAGGGPPDGLQATTIGVAWLNGVAVDTSGNLYIPSPLGSRVFKVTPAGVATTVAGNGSHGYSGDGGSATSAQLDYPYGVAIDSAGNIYIADTGNNRIRKVSGGVITTVAGNGTFGFSGDGGPATSAQLSQPWNVAVDTSGNLYIADLSNQRIRKVSGGLISTVAGNGTAGYSGDNGQATSASLNNPRGVGVDASGNFYIADTANNRIRKVSGGLITTVVGTGIASFSGDGGQATSAQINSPYGVRLDGAGNLYVADSGNNCIRKVSGGVINTVAGNTGFSFSGDGGPAINATFEFPTDVAIDASGNLYIADNNNQRIRKVSSGIINTVAGNGTNGQSGDGGLATLAQIALPHSVAVDSSGNLYISDTFDSAIRKVSGGGISTVAGNGSFNYSGDGGPATSARLNTPEQVAVDGSGNIYIADSKNNRVRKVSAGVITTVAGTGTAAFGGDGGSATSAQLNNPMGVAVDGAGNLYISDSGNNRIRKVSAGVITTIAGTGTAGFGGDGGSATSAQLNTPGQIAVDSGGSNLYIADSANNRVRRVSVGVITTVAGNGNAGYGGDGGPAASAQLSYPTAVALDVSGNLYIADSNNLRVRKVAGGVISTVAGNGNRGFSGDGGLATNATLNFPYGIALGSGGNLYLADSASNRIRLVSGTTTTTIATSPSGRTVVVDGTTYTAPQSFTWTAGTLHTVSLPTPQSGSAGTQYSFSAWADGPTSNPRNIVAPSTTATYTANFTTQFQLSTTVSPPGAGTVTPSGGFYTSGTSVQLTATANPGYGFSVWSGGLTGSQNPQSVLMSAPVTVTANFGCAPSVGSTAVSVSSGSGTLSIPLTTGATCGWSSSSTAGWLTPNPPTSGTASATVTFAVAANPGTTPRIGSVTVAGIPIQVTQAGVACTFALAPNFTLPLSPSSQSYSFALNATASSCGWTASANATWVHLNQTSGAGTTTIGFSTDANPFPSISRTATITAGGQNLVLVQAPTQPLPCTFALPRSSVSFPAGSGSGSAGTGSAAVSTGSGCAWTATSNALWIHITGGASGTGNGSVSYSVDSNPGTTLRTGSLTIAGLTYSISQPGSQAYACTATASPLTLRSQGRTELLGDLVLTCGGQLPAGAVAANISLALNTNFSSRITDPAAGTTEALLLVNDPSTPALGTNAFLGRVAGYNVVRWQNVPLTGAATKLRLTNVRADASLLSTPTVTATVSVQATIPVPVTNPLQTLGQATQGVSFQPGQPLPGPSPSTQTLLQVSFQEGTATSFKMKLASNQNPSTPGAVYNTESGFVNTSVLGSGVGQATSGTLLQLTISNVPTYMQVYVPMSDVDGKTRLYGATGGTLQPGTFYTGLTQPAGTSSTSTWEVLVANPAQLETLTFNLLVQNAVSTDPNLAQIQLTGALGPLTSATGASATAAIPRFADPTSASRVVNLRATSALVPTSAPVSGRPGLARVRRFDTGVLSGSNVSFSQTVLNDTDGAASNVVVRDNLPPGLILTGCSSSDGTNCVMAGNNAQVNYGEMDPGETRTITVLALVDPSVPDGTVLENDFTAASDQAPLNLQNNTAGLAVVVTVNPAAPTVAITAPADGATVSGVVQVTGWALDNANRIGTAITGVQVLVDGNVVGDATYGQSSTACNTYPNRPGCPNVGYTFSLNTAGLTAGLHQLTVVATDSDLASDSGSAAITIQVVPLTYTISGQVTLFGGGNVANVVLTLSGSQTATKSPDPSGYYSFAVNPGGTYTVAAVLPGYTLAPISRTFINLTASQIANFTGSGALQFYPLPPCRVADTRSFTGPPSALGPPSMTAQSTRSFPVLASACGIPSNAVAYSFNVSALPLNGYLGYLTIWGTGQPMPIASTLNSWDGRLVANAAFVPAGTSGGVSIYVSDATDVFFDINGYYAPPGTGSLEFYPLAPCRIADTRSFTGPPSALGPPSMAAHTSRSFPVLSSACGIPASAVAYSLNMSAVPINGYLGYLTTWATGQPQPNASTLNSWTGTIVANAAIVPAGTLGAISIYASDATDVFFDINGYFAPPGAGGLQYRPVAPCRIADTRSFSGPAGPLGPPSMGAQTSRSFPVLMSVCGVPSMATVYAMNVTAQPTTNYLGYLTTWATGQSQPNASTLNSWTGTIVPNMALVPAGAGGAISIYASDATDVFFDINGFFAP